MAQPITREEEIAHKSFSYKMKIYHENHCPFKAEWDDVRDAFAAGARWADETRDKHTEGFD